MLFVSVHSFTVCKGRSQCCSFGFIVSHYAKAEDNAILSGSQFHSIRRPKTMLFVSVHSFTVQKDHVDLLLCNLSSPSLVAISSGSLSSFLGLSTATVHT